MNTLGRFIVPIFFPHHPRRPTLMSPLDPVRAAGMLLVHGSPSQPHQFLLMKHADRWDLPKGHCDGDESFLDAAIREVREETGIKRHQYRIDPQFQFDLTYPVTYRRSGNQVFQKQVRYFLAFVDQPWPVKLTEHPDSAWIEWHPPHAIQTQTIDPLLAAVAQHVAPDDHGATITSI